jgi:hypothetical protein
MAQRQAATPAAPEATTDASGSTLRPGANDAVGGARTVPHVPAETSPHRSDRILECDHPELGKVYTNAATCAAADVHNRLSYAEPLAKTPAQARYSGEMYQPPAEQAQKARTSQKPNLRLLAKAPPDGLNVSCKFAVGRALELERALSAAADPRESAWREDYCKWRCEAIAEDCGVDDSYFYYRYQRLCREENLDGC